MVAAEIYEEGTYTCVASNKAGSDLRDFQLPHQVCNLLLYRLAPYQLISIDDVIHPVTC